ncbi:MAG TPA: oxygenase MpaB family protein [Ktedonobacteraceae bacterium]|nr:oxygenase MpaB family protein [Ktedonobacteraceae bacterium]
MSDHGSYGPGSVTWKVGQETAVLLGGARAVLMQIAHPLVAAGVSEHSSYLSDPYGRTVHTFLLGEMLSFGSTTTAREAAHTINRLHAHVHGTLSTTAGDFTRGAPYRARDPELLLWVQATLVDTLLEMYTLLIGPLSAEEQERYYQESKESGRLLGLPANAMPATVTDLRRYVDQMVHSNKLAATPQARRLAQVVLYPPLPTPLRPLLHLNLQFTCGTLPQPVREIYGLEWNARQQRLFDWSVRGLRLSIARLPMSLRVLPITQRLMSEGSLRRPPINP